MIRVVVAISMLSFLSFLPPVAADDEKPSGRESWYTSTLVSGRGGYRVTHYWSRGPALRTQTLMGVSPITTIVRGDRYWVYDELLGEGIEIKRSPSAIAEDPDRGRPFGNDLAKLIASNGERVETGELSGIPAEIWRVTNSRGRRTVWVTVEEPQVPLRVENFHRESGESATLNYSNWASGLDIPDRFFEPPPNLKFMTFEYEAFVAASLKGPLGAAPILYPELIHGPRPE